MSDNVRPTIVGDNINGAALLAMQREDFKDIGVTQVGPLALMLKEITNLCREKKSEAVFVDHDTYCFGKILDTLRLQSMCQSEGTMPPVYIQESYRERFKKLWITYFLGILHLLSYWEGRLIQRFCPNAIVIKWRVGW